MKINVNDSNKLNDTIQQVEGKRVSARLITAEYITDEIENIERNISTLLYKKDWKGLKFDIDPNGQSFAASYNGIPKSTQVRIERFASGWFVTDITRGLCNSMVIYPVNMKTKAEQLVEFASNYVNWNRG